MNNSDTEKADRPEHPGMHIRQAREAAGISLEDVADALKLPVRSIEALEEGRYEALAGGTFVRGYLRNYCRLLKLNTEQVIECYYRYVTARNSNTVQSEDAPTASVALGSSRDFQGPAKYLSMAFQHRQHKTVYGLGVALFLAGVMAWFNVGGQLDLTLHEGLNVVMVETAKGVTIVGPLSEYEDEELDVGEAMENLPSLSQAQSTTENGAALFSSESGGTDETGGALDTIGIGGRIDVVKQVDIAGRVENSAISQLSFYFTADCWVEVQDGSNKLIYANLAHAEDSLQLEGKPPFNVKLGYAPAVSLSYNGELVDIRSHRESKTVEITLGSS